MISRRSLNEKRKKSQLAKKSSELLRKPATISGTMTVLHYILVVAMFVITPGAIMLVLLLWFAANDDG
jgi:uncharacterized membrane protein HdeD (DUF308 family)